MESERIQNREKRIRDTWGERKKRSNILAMWVPARQRKENRAEQCLMMAKNKYPESDKGPSTHLRNAANLSRWITEKGAPSGFCILVKVQTSVSPKKQICLNGKTTRGNHDEFDGRMTRKQWKKSRDMPSWEVSQKEAPSPKEMPLSGEVSGFIRRGIKVATWPLRTCWNTFITCYGCQCFHIFCLPYPIICYDGDREDILKIPKSNPLELNLRKAECVLKDPSH